MDSCSGPLAEDSGLDQDFGDKEEEYRMDSSTAEQVIEPVLGGAGWKRSGYQT